MIDYVEIKNENGGYIISLRLYTELLEYPDFRLLVELMNGETWPKN